MSKTKNRLMYQKVLAVFAVIILAFLSYKVMSNLQASNACMKEGIAKLKAKNGGSYSLKEFGELQVKCHLEKAD